MSLSLFGVAVYGKYGGVVGGKSLIFIVTGGLIVGELNLLIIFVDSVDCFDRCADFIQVEKVNDVNHLKKDSYGKSVQRRWIYPQARRI